MSRALEFFSGIGGLHLAFARSSGGTDRSVVQAFDWDQNACRVYAVNHPPHIVNKVDISTLTASYLASFQADVWLLSPACQPYTVLNPTALGASDPRARSFLHLVQHILPSMVSNGTHPLRILIENVAGFETSSTRQLTLVMLQSLGYATVEFLLTPLQFGIPNSRLRYYLLAKKAPLSFSGVTDSSQIKRHIPAQGRDRADPAPAQLEAMGVREVREYLDDDRQVPLAMDLYAVPDRVLYKWGRLFDIVLPSSRRSCCFTRGYTHLVERAGSILQMNEQLDTKEIFDAFLHAQKEVGPDAVRVLHPLLLRYFSPDELLRIFDFNSSADFPVFKWPKELTTKTKYRLIGNSVNVRVVKELIEYLFDD